MQTTCQQTAAESHGLIQVTITQKEAVDILELSQRSRKQAQEDGEGDGVGNEHLLIIMIH